MRYSLLCGRLCQDSGRLHVKLLYIIAFIITMRMVLSYFNQKSSCTHTHFFRPDFKWSYGQFVSYNNIENVSAEFKEHFGVNVADIT